MKTEKILIYSNTLDKEIHKEFTIYKRDELIKFIQDSNIDLSMFGLEVYAPYCFKCTIEVLETMDKNDEFFIFEEDKEIHLYLS